MKAGKPQRQAVAIAMSKAGKKRKRKLLVGSRAALKNQVRDFFRSGLLKKGK